MVINVIVIIYITNNLDFDVQNFQYYIIYLEYSNEQNYLMDISSIFN
jgi:hypothetical protein